VDVLIIAPTNGTRHLPLIDQLRRQGDLDVHLVSAVMLKEIPSDFDDGRSRAFSARTLTPGEIGCATSHRKAWEHFLATDDEWVCIFEDDARVVDADALNSLLKELRHRPVGRSAEVISLFTLGAVLEHWPVTPFTRCLFEPPSAVAYCINRAAAEALCETNQDSTQLADWPRCSGVSFHLALGHMIRHGDEATGSLIGSERFKSEGSVMLGARFLPTRRVLHRLSLYTFVHYLRHHRHFDTPLHYYRIILRQRVLWHLGRLAGRKVDSERSIYVLNWRCNRFFGPACGG
jgi:hypothetical protein